MKRNYIIPATESVAFRAGFICQAGSSGADENLNINIPGINTGGGEGLGGNPD